MVRISAKGGSDPVTRRRASLWGLWMGMLLSTGIYAWLYEALTTFHQIPAVGGLPLFLLITFFIGVQFAIFLPLARVLKDLRAR